MRIRTLLVLSLLGMLVAACGSGDDDDSTETTTASTSTATVESAASPSTSATPTTSPAASPTLAATPGPASPTMNPGTPVAEIEIPDTPVGGQFAWVLETINSGATDLTPEMVEERFSPEFLAEVPADQLIEILQSVAVAGPYTLSDFQGSPSPLQAAGLLSSTAGQTILLNIAVEEPEPHQITGLNLQPALIPVALESWDDVDVQLAGLAATSNFLAAEIVDQECVPIHALNPESRLAIGSGFKLYVLGELARQIEAGQIAWDDEITITDELKSLPFGELQDEPDGTTVTVQRAAELMISISDNTAADLLLHELGRENVEAIQSDMGHGEPERNIPFLTTRELFVLKLVMPRDRVDAYIAGTDDEQRAILDTDVANADLSLEDAAGWTSPRYIDEIEWFASPEDLCRALVWLYEASSRPGLEPIRDILSINPGVPVDPEVWTWVGFKGGSELGVLNMNWLLERADGRTFVISANLNDQSQHIDETATANLLMGAMNLLAEEE